MTKTQKYLTTLEVMVLFGPITVLFAYGILAALGSLMMLAEEPVVPILAWFVIIAGGYGLYVFLQLAKVTLGEAEALPKLADPIYGFIAGSLPCLGLAGMAMMELSPAALIFIAPILGGSHLLYLNRNLI